MNTTIINRTMFSHNGGNDGDVRIIKEGGGEVTIPFNDIKGFVAEYVRKSKISKLESEDYDKILGLVSDD